MAAPDQISSRDLLFQNIPVPETNFITFKLEPYNNIVISTGGFGIVHICRRTDTSALVALKKMRYSEDQEMNEIMDRSLVKDITPLMVCRNRYILEYLGLTRGEHPGVVSAYAENKSLISYLKTAINTDGRIEILREVAAGLAYLHKPDPEIIYNEKKLYIVHGDLHPGNVLIMGDGRAVLADFGLCKISQDDGSVSQTARAPGEGPAGVPAYVAPEVYSPKKGIIPEVKQRDEYSQRRTVKADVFAYGMLMFTALGGNVKSSLGTDRFDVVVAILTGQRPTRTQIPRVIEDNVWNIMEDCWKGDASARPTMEEVSARIGFPA